MERTWRAAVLGLFAVQYAIIGGWAVAAPRNFYDEFPGGGWACFAVDGPYNEHLVRDVGALLTATCVVSIYALVERSPAAARATGLLVAVFSLPHTLYHAATAGLLPADEGIVNVVTLGAVLALACALVVSPGPTTSAERLSTGRPAETGPGVATRLRARCAWRSDLTVV